jgi:hypothetical protein
MAFLVRQPVLTEDAPLCQRNVRDGKHGDVCCAVPHRALPVYRVRTAQDKIPEPS